jgi:hypothetical protein
MVELSVYRDILHRVVSFTSLCSGAVQKLEIHNLVPEGMRYRYENIGNRVLLTDFAGRDSIAACMQILKDEEIDTVIPVGDIVPSRYGDTDSYSQNWNTLAQLMKKNHTGIDLKPWFIVDGQDFWKTLNQRYVQQIMEKFGWFTPCVGCHFHFYAMRSVLVEILGHDNIILASGEKRLHKNGKRKANQTVAAVKAYGKFSLERGIDHRFPIHNFEFEEQIGSLVGAEWKEGGSQMSCIHSGNDQDDNGQLKFTEEQISEMMTEYILPMGKKYIEMKMDAGSINNFWDSLDNYSDELLRWTR